MTTSAFLIGDNSAAASLPRQQASRLAKELGFNDVRAGQVALVVSELATNIAKHAGGGHILVQPTTDGDRHGIELWALDKGPGLPPHALQDGYSTAGSLGTGLGTIRRQADTFEVFVQPRVGTVCLVRLWAEKSVQSAPSFSAISVPIAGEIVCGDGWAQYHDLDRQVFIVVDGLGHGPQAATAATAATEVFRSRPLLAPGDLIEEIHLALRHTRGAAVAIAAIDITRGLVRYAGVGNIAGSIVSAEAPRQGLASHNGTAGVAMRRIQEFTYPMHRDAVLVMHTDGLATHWNAGAYTGLWLRDPALAAGVLFRDHTRGRDDSTVLVAQLRTA